jgi:hypothetical protein
MAVTRLSEGADASVGIYERENKIDFGLIEFDEENRLRMYREKPTSKYYVSHGSLCSPARGDTPARR